MARNDQIVRILTMARTLASSRRGVPLKTLAERHGWSLRSLYRDIEALERAGFPIVNEESRYRLKEGWDAPALPGLESEEILALYSLRALADTWRVSSVGRALDRLWMKLTSGGAGQSRLFPPVREPWFRVQAPFAIDYRPHEHTIATLEKAVREQIAVDCRYRALSTREITTRTIEPGELYWDPRLESLYAIGWCRLRSDVRVFAVHRFLGTSLTGERFAPRSGARSRTALRDSFRVWRARQVETVRVRFSGGAADEIRERRWGPGQRIEEEEGGAVVLTLEVAGLAEVERWVLGYSAQAEVLAPDQLRRSVRDKLATGARRYGRLPAMSVSRDETRAGYVRRPGGALRRHGRR